MPCMLQSIESQGVGHNPETEQQICSNTSYNFEVCSPLFLLQERMYHQKRERERERENVSYYLVLHLEVESRSSQFFGFLLASIDLHLACKRRLYTKISD